MTFTTSVNLTEAQYHADRLRELARKEKRKFARHDLAEAIKFLQSLVYSPDDESPAVDD